MADDKTKNAKENNSEREVNINPVAEMHVSQIIAALHQNAIAHCANDLADKYRIVNSAIDDTGENPVLTAQGEHIISVIPTEKAAQDESWTKLGTLPKETAVKVLKTYVQWFVGPDLAKKVTDKTVQSLTDAPKSMEDVKAREAQKKETQQNIDKDLVDGESFKPIIKFSQFIREAEFDDLKKSSEKNSSEEDKEKESGEKREKEDSSKEDKAKKSKLQKIEPTPQELQAGYYITYDMKVEGLKKEAKLEDSKKSIRKSIFNYLRNFFDDVKITASGLFGGGDSFTVKDIKDKIRANFGPIDPDELARNVEERLRKKFAGSSPDARVWIQDRRTLISDLGKYVKSADKKKIEKAEYSLVIRVDQDDPKKDVLNRGLVADIVQASIKGLWKKFRNRIKVNDVIYIENYKNIHADTEKIRKLYHEVPSPNQIREYIKNSKNVNDAISKIKKRLEKILGNSFKDDCPRADSCIDVWLKFKKDNKVEDRSEELSAIDKKSASFYKFFESFVDLYTKAYNDTEDDSLNESTREICFTVSNSAISDMILESMFGSSSELSYEELEEADSSDDKEKSSDVKKSEKDSSADNSAQEKESFSAADAVDMAKYYLNQKFSNIVVNCGAKTHMQKLLKHYADVSEKFNSSKCKNALIAFSEKDSEKTALQEMSIEDSIFSLIFENHSFLLAEADGASTDEPKSAKHDEQNDISDDNGKKKESASDAAAVVEKALRKALTEANAHKVEEFFVFKPKTIDEEDKSSKPAKKILEAAYALMFGDEEEPISKPASSEEIDASASYSGEKHSNDMYIVPMPGLKYEDPEYANKKLM